MKKFVLSIGCILSLLLPLAQAESPKEEELRVKLPPVVIVGEETLKAEALGRVPLPTLITTVHRERPPLEVGELGREAEKTLERPSPTVRSPGCAYSTAVTATVAQVIKGIAVLAVLSFLANLINLRASSWMLGKFWTWGVIAFIILFQSELKQALSSAPRLRLAFTLLAPGEPTGKGARPACRP